MVPENIHTPSIERTGNSEGVGGGGGGVGAPENSKGAGGGIIKTTFQGVYFELSTKITTYWSGRSFLETFVFLSKPGFLSSKSIM